MDQSCFLRFSHFSVSVHTYIHPHHYICSMYDLSAGSNHKTKKNINNSKWL